jgi:hypothetical protein
MNSKTLGIRFFPVVTFVVNCTPADTIPAGNHYEGSKRSMNGACRLAESAVRSASEVRGNARAPGQP